MIRVGHFGKILEKLPLKHFQSASSQTYMMDTNHVPHATDQESVT